MTGLVQDETEQPQRRGIVRRQRKRAAVRADGVFERPAPIQHGAEIAEQSWIIGIDLERMAISRFRFVEPRLLHEQIAEIEPGAGIRWFPGKDRAISLFRLSEPPLLREHDGQIEAGPRQMRVECQRPAIGGLGLLEASEFAECDAELVVQACVVRPPDQGTPEGRQCALLLALHRERVAERDERRCMVGIDNEDASEQRGTLGRPVGDEGDDGGEVQRRHMIRIGLQNLCAERICPVRVPRRKVLRRLRHDPIHSRIAHDTAPSRSEMGVKRATSEIPSVGVQGQRLSDGLGIGMEKGRSMNSTGPF